MTGAELVKINRNALELMSKSDLRADDHRYIPLYDTYQRMREDGEKVNYIIAHLAEEYGISESSVKRIVRRLSAEVKV